MKTIKVNMLNGDVRYVESVPEGMNCVTFCDSVFLRGGSDFNEVESHKTMSISAGKRS